MNTFLLSVWRINTQLVAQKWNMAPLLLRLFTTREVKLKPLALLSRRYLPNATESGANSPVTARVHRRSVHYISLDKRGRRTVGMRMGGGSDQAQFTGNYPPLFYIHYPASIAGVCQRALRAARSVSAYSNRCAAEEEDAACSAEN